MFKQTKYIREMNVSDHMFTLLRQGLRQLEQQQQHPRTAKHNNCMYNWLIHMFPHIRLFLFCCFVFGLSWFFQEQNPKRT